MWFVFLPSALFQRLAGLLKDDGKLRQLIHHHNRLGGQPRTVEVVKNNFIGFAVFLQVTNAFNIQAHIAADFYRVRKISLSRYCCTESNIFAGVPREMLEAIGVGS